MNTMKAGRILEFDNILFDLDGTLTDSKEGIINSILYALERLGITENKLDALESFIGPPLRESFMKRYHLSNDDAGRAVLVYREYFSDKGLYQNRLYPGITDLLQFLVHNQYRLFVATSKPTMFATRILAHFQLDACFDGITGSNPDNTRTDKTDVIGHVVSAYGLNASRSVMIGDRKHDIIGARNNSMACIGVTWGYGSVDEIESQQPDAIANTVDELRQVFVADVHTG
jgi:phosphoglycolate phosphatase